MAGVLIGHFLPGVPEVLGKLQIAGISIPIAVLIWIMIYPMMIKVDFQSIREVGKNPKGLFLTWVVNWLIKLNAYAMFFKQEEFAPEREYRLVFRNPDRSRIQFREKEGFLLPYIVIDLSDEKQMPLNRVTVAPKNHVDLAKKGMSQYLDLLGYDVPVELSRLKLRY